MPNADLNNSRVKAVMKEATTLNTFTAADWYDLAAVALDQAGFSLRQQQAFYAVLDRPEEE